MPAVMGQHGESIQPGCQRPEFLMPWLQSAKMIIPMTHGVSSVRRDLGLLTLLAKPNTRTFWHSGRQLAYFVFLQQRVCKYRSPCDCMTNLRQSLASRAGNTSHWCRNITILSPWTNLIPHLPMPSNCLLIFQGVEGPRRMSQ